MREVTGARPGQLTTNVGTFSVGHVVNAAGLHADRIAGLFGMCDDCAVLPFRGVYWYGDWTSGKLRRQVYTVPDPRNPFLGVHLTVTADGRTKIGPTAIPVMWRESYRGPRGISARDIAEFGRLFPRFLRSPHYDVPGLIRAELPKYWRRQMVLQARRLVPSIEPRHFTERGRPGVRAQLLHFRRAGSRWTSWSGVTGTPLTS